MWCRLARGRWLSRWGSCWRGRACVMCCPYPKHASLLSSLLWATPTPRSATCLHTHTALLSAHCSCDCDCDLSYACTFSLIVHMSDRISCAPMMLATYELVDQLVVATQPSLPLQVDVTVNNILAIVNTKLLKDYGAIDGRLLQLVFVVKLWAKRRQVNDSYRGTLSSYCYVLMCIHLLQQRSPPILPCLQAMEPTHTRYLRPSPSPHCSLHPFHTHTPASSAVLKHTFVWFVSRMRA